LIVLVQVIAAKSRDVASASASKLKALPSELDKRVSYFRFGKREASLDSDSDEGGDEDSSELQETADGVQKRRVFFRFG